MRSLLNQIKHYFKNDDGSTIIIVALSFTFLTVIVALIIDIGIAYYKTGETENAADASALAAGQLLPVKEDDAEAITKIKDTVIEYAAKNGVKNLLASNISLNNLVNGYYSQLTVNIPVHMETSFAKIIGVNSIDIKRSAKVKITPCKKITDVVPLSIEKAGMDYRLANNITTHLALKYGGGDGTTGSYGAIDLDGIKGGGANDYYVWLAYGYTTQLSAGEELYPVESGNMAGPTNTAFIQRYNDCTHYPGLGGCTIEHYSNNCPRVVKVPIVEYMSDRKYVKIRGFAAFILEPLTDSGYVYGSFIKMTVPGVPSDNVSFGNALDYGLYNIKLASES